MVSSKKPDFVFLIETMVKSDHAERLRVKLGFEGVFYVDPERQRGGLALLWRYNNTARLISYSKNHVDVEVTLDNHPPWRMTCYYGFPKRSMRRESWELLKRLSMQSTLPWVVIGDFNDLLFQSEKRGNNPHPEGLLRGFGETLDYCGLLQLPMEGYLYTWERGEGTEDWVEEKLDRAVATMEWRELLVEAKTVNILTRKSNHSAIFLSISNPMRFGVGGPRAFRFEMAWLLDSGCRGVVEQAWLDGQGNGLLHSLQLCKDRLQAWGGDRFHMFGKQLKLLQAKLMKLKGGRGPAVLAEYNTISAQLSRLEAQEDVYWRQRAKQHWLRGADANTKFYHRYVSSRKRKNFLNKLKGVDGNWVTKGAMNTVVIDYFVDIFKSSNAPPHSNFFGTVLPRVSESHNESLLEPFVAEEVKRALFAMYPDKAPGLDGMNPGFYQHFWGVVGPEVTEFVLNCLNTGVFPEGLNDSNVVLIPKKKVPENPADLRPIALRNVVYKIMAKMIANRMKPFMDSIVSESQSAFIPDRLITDNILVAAEVGHFLNRKQCGKTGWGALKLDMAKAYDKMEWSFLRQMMIALGFAEGWVNLIMLCVTSVSYNILINGAVGGVVVPSRGLRQGDPLSPYLFIICAEGLSLMLQQAQSLGTIHGCRVARGAPAISHLFFADDSLLFFKANAQEGGAVKQCLELYEKLSGQSINYHKSSICCSKNTTDEERDEVAAVFGVAQANDFGKYLGLPSFIGKNKKQVFAFIEEKIRQRVGSWNKKLLSQAGKEILLKTVAQAMPTFSMGVFLLTDSLCVALQRTMNRYYWEKGGTGGGGIHWMAWDRLSRPKVAGGLGFKDLKAFNLAMLGKQAWRFLTKPESLAAKVYKARYYPKSNFIDATVGNNPSYCWRSIMAAHGLVCGGIKRRIGNGGTTMIGVSGLIDQDTRTWDLDILNDIFDPVDVNRIRRVPVCPDYEDSWYWYKEHNGSYSVKSAYRSVVGEIQNNTGFNRWNALWKLEVPPRWKTFLWRAISGILPTMTALASRRVDVSLACLMCLDFNEDVMHCLIECQYACRVWNDSGLDIASVVGGSFVEWFQNAMSVLTMDNLIKFVAVLYHLWSARNSAVWEGSMWMPRKLWSCAKASLAAWAAALPRGPRTTQQHHSSAMQQHPPVTHGAVCYVDAAWSSLSRTASYGAVILDGAGAFVAATRGQLPFCENAIIAEALACKEALSWLKDRQVTEVTMFTDCSVLQAYLSRTGSQPRSYVGIVVHECQVAMAQFISCQFNFIPRRLNVIAHTLATMVTDQDIAMFWDDVPPDVIIPHL
ncbi:PREDICTED: uncharacterized protein LOC109175373 [Ipomoea nil]|uniref:uncharacterized protein LOC109175373 n=1 Tax=Ipomoea nil TaxID=35883 RepID=UPI00090168CE|nr:PREDICTED: uncharacterized protein LOC109175373 [Ipomoea nil]